MASRSSSSDPANPGLKPLWPLFTNACTGSEGEAVAAALRPKRQPWPEPPPWRRFLELSAEDAEARELERQEDDYWQLCAAEGVLHRDGGRLARDRRRGHVFRLPRRNGQPTEEAQQVLMAVNAAIHLRRPLLVTGRPGIGKSSLAHAIAVELGLGPVLTWAVTPRSQLTEGGLYLYDAVARLQDSNFGRGNGQHGEGQHGEGKQGVRPSSDYITLGPVGTAFLPFHLPRVLLIDEVDKGDLQLPHELLHLFEEGVFEIPQLVRDARTAEAEPAWVHTADGGGRWPIQKGRVQCRAFPIIVLTSNGEREFPAAFHRRCIRLELPSPTEEDLRAIVEAQFGSFSGDPEASNLAAVIRQFLEGGQQLDRATDQLLNAWHLLRSPRTARAMSDAAEPSMPSDARAEDAMAQDSELPELIDALGRILFQELNS